MINITEILKKSPKEAVYYSPLCGDCTIEDILEFTIVVAYKAEGKSKYFTVNSFGQYTEDGECVLFPSRDNKDWNTVDICPFKTFNKVLVRDRGQIWCPAFFSYYDDKLHKYHVIGKYTSFEECIPYNNNTKCYMGTNKPYIDNEENTLY